MNDDTLLTAPLPPAALARRCDPDSLNFRTTAELTPLIEPLGQERALAAVRFAVGMRSAGFNLFALGPEGTGKRSLLKSYLGDVASGRRTPDDWVYVHNFAEPHKPRALRLPPGRAFGLKTDMEHLIDDLRASIRAAFEAEEYRARRQVLEEESKDRRDQARLADLPQIAREDRRKLRRLDSETAMAAVAHSIDETRGNWSDMPDVLAYLDAVRGDVVANLGDFLERGQDESPTEASVDKRRQRSEARFRRYQVNVLVSRRDQQGAPVVVVDHPTQPNLVGRVEHEADMGALITDFRLIKAGDLHRANGGFLILEARKVLENPFAWEDLKRALSAGQIRIESPGQSSGLVPTVSLEAEPIPLDIKVALTGEPMLYYLLAEEDPDFNSLFKVAADFDWRMARSAEHERGLARAVAGLTRAENLRPLDAPAVARLVEHASRLAGDNEKLITHMASLADLVREADHWAAEDGAVVIGALHVDRAIDQHMFRQDRVRGNVLEEITRDTILIDTSGEAIGQVNALVVMELGRFVFARPSRLTCRVHLGRGEVIDIEREVDLGGPLHSKGVMILGAFLSARFAQDTPLSLAASLVFEQSYGEVDGDSASSAELYCLLSALADAPIRQNLAVTGSVDQLGQIQAIGGVNEKIEGFFDVCQARGLTGDQGVLIPAANVKHLMLRRDVVEACAAGRFAVHPVATVDQGIEVLTGIPAGRPGPDGLYPPGTINRRVAARLSLFGHRARVFMQEGGGPPPQRGRRDFQ